MDDEYRDGDGGWILRGWVIIIMDDDDNGLWL